MTPRAHRLTKQEILSLWKNSHSLADINFRFLYQHQTTGKLKWQVKVSAKTSKKAVHRHRSRRLVDEAIKDATNIYQDKGLNLLILVKKDLYQKKQAEVTTLLKPLLTKIKIT